MRVLNVNSKGTIGFYKMAASVEHMSANKAWLDISSLASAKGSVYLDFSNIDSETTGITEVNATDNLPSQREGIYDMQGRRVEKPGKGLYIVDGKKVLYK